MRVARSVGFNILMHLGVETSSVTLDDCVDVFVEVDGAARENSSPHAHVERFAAWDVAQKDSRCRNGFESIGFRSFFFVDVHVRPAAENSKVVDVGFAAGD